MDPFRSSPVPRSRKFRWARRWRSTGFTRGQPERLRYIASLGLKPGVQVTVVDRQPFDDLVTIEVGGAQHVIGRELGHVLQCAPVEP